MWKDLVLLFLVINLIGLGESKTLSTTTESPTTECDDVATTTESDNTTTTEECPSTTESENTTTTEEYSTITESETTTTEECPTSTESETTTTEKCPTSTEANTTTTEDPDTTTTEECPTSTEANTTTTEDPDTTTTEECPTSTEADTTTTEDSDTTSTEECPTSTESETTTTEECPTSTEANTTTTEDPDTTTTEECQTSTEADTTTTEDSDTTTTEECPTSTEANTTTTEDPDTTTTEECPTSTEADTTTTEESDTTTTEECPTSTEADTTTTEDYDTTTTEECPNTTESGSLTTTEEYSTTTDSKDVTCSSSQSCACSDAWDRFLTATWEIAVRSFQKLLQVDATTPTLNISILDIINYYEALGTYAKGITLQEILRAIYLENLFEINCVSDAMKAYVADIPKYNPTDVEYTSYGEFLIFDSNTHTLMPNFIKVMKNNFYITSLTADYDNVKQAVGQISKEVKNYTSNIENIDMTIPNLSDVIENTSGLGFIIQANILFKAKPVKGFTETTQAPFYITPTKPQNKVVFYEKNECLPWWKSKTAQIVRMPMAGAFSILLILPNPGRSVELEIRSLNSDTINEIFENLKCTSVRLSIPKLTNIDCTIDTKQNQILTTGNATYFNKKAEFSGVVKSDKPAWIEKAYQRCVMVEDYKQASPESITGEQCDESECSSQNVKVVNYNRPFITIVTKDLASDACTSGCKPYPLPVIVGAVRSIPSP